MLFQGLAKGRDESSRYFQELLKTEPQAVFYLDDVSAKFWLLQRKLYSSLSTVARKVHAILAYSLSNNEKFCFLRRIVFPSCSR